VGASPDTDLVVADDERAFADAVVRLLRDPAEADAVGRRGRDFVTRCRTWERACDLVDEIYRRVATG
jgi:glycosyltransferase involved in cell wall biosynthesis